jgi:hypothetical protein
MRFSMLILALLLFAGPASAGPLTSATLVIQGASHALAGITISAGAPSGGTAQGTGATATWTVPAGAFATATATNNIATAVPPLSETIWTVLPNAAGSFAAGTLNAMSVPGGWRGRYGGGITILALGVASRTATPLRIGTPTTAVGVPAYGVSITGLGDAWTSGTAIVTVSSNAGASIFTAHGANSLVAGAGSVQLVAPYVIRTSVVPPLVYFATLTLNFVPEPGTGVLALAGAALLAAAGARRSRG